MQSKTFIKNRNGLDLSVIIETPQLSKKLPTVILLHGFKGYKEEETYTDLANKLSQVGIASVRFDASGFGESEGTLEKNYRFSNYINDTEDIYNWLKQQVFCDQKRIGICGQSMGAAQAIIFTSNHLEIKVVCAISPPDKIGTQDALGKVTDKWKQDGYIEDISSKYGKIRIPYSYLVDAQKYNFSEIVKKIKCPILIVLGKKDTTVLPEQSKLVYKAAKKPKQLLEFAEMDHYYKRNPKLLNEVNKKVVELLTKNLSL